MKIYKTLSKDRKERKETKGVLSYLPSMCKAPKSLPEIMHIFIYLHICKYI